MLVPNTGMVMDEETTRAFDKVYAKIDQLKCVERGIELATLKQRFNNGEKAENKAEELRHKKKIEGLTVYRVLMGAGVFIIGVITLLNSFGVFR